VLAISKWVSWTCTDCVGIKDSDTGSCACLLCLYMGGALRFAVISRRTAVWCLFVGVAEDNKPDGNGHLARFLVVMNEMKTLEWTNNDENT
jgi:hypothetical protein